MDRQRIVMHYTVSPSAEDLEAIAVNIWDSLPGELLTHCEDVALLVEDMADDITMDDLDLDDPYELLALYKNGKEISPGVEMTVANDDDVLVLYRRAILDMWCETGDDLQNLLRQVLIEELGRYFDFPDEDIEEMADRYIA